MGGDSGTPITTITLAVSLSVLALILLIVFTVVACRPSAWPFTGIEYRAKASKALQHTALVRAEVVIEHSRGGRVPSPLGPTRTFKGVIDRASAKEVARAAQSGGGASKNEHLLSEMAPPVVVGAPPIDRAARSTELHLAALSRSESMC